MASVHDNAVLRVIFSPNSPFGELSDKNQEEALTDDGEYRRKNGEVVTHKKKTFQ